MKPIPIGTSSAGDVSIDVKKLLVSKAFVCANSGGGKSYLLRKIAEGTIPQVQTIILDPEGEYATLREKFDLLLVGPAGEVATDPRTAATLARKISELGISAVIDLSDLDLAGRRRFVRLFCEALVDLPRAQWHSKLIVIDEAHMFVPEKGNDESESGKAVIDLLVRGRKRGIGAILASQRLSKVHKDAEAECNNIFVGRTAQDLDQKRSASLLGITPKDAIGLRDLNPGEFHLFGPAIHGIAGVGQMKVTPAATTHPTPGSKHIAAPPKASDAVQKLVAGIAADLPKIADEEARTLAEAKAQIVDLRRQVKAAGKPPAARTVEVSSKREQIIIRNLRKGLEEAMKVIAQINASGFEKTNLDPEQIKKAVEVAAAQIVKMVEADIARKGAAFDKLKKDANRILLQLQKLLAQDVEAAVNVKANDPFTFAPSTEPRSTNPTAPQGAGDFPSKSAQAKIINSLAWWSACGVHAPSRVRVAMVAGYTVNGHFTNVVGELVRSGYVESPDSGLLKLTEQGSQIAAPVEGALGRDELIDRVRNVLRSEAHRKVFNALVKEDRTLSREDLAQASGYTVNGHFTNVVGELTRLDVITIPRKGEVALNPELFAE